MATTLRDFIAQRETEIRDQQRALKAELRDLQLAKAALEGQPAAVPSAPSGITATIKDMARDVLSGQPSGLNSSGILDAIKKRFGRDIERTSLSPQLSRLKEEGELILSGEVWFTAEHHKANKAQWDTKDAGRPSTSDDWGQPTGHFADDIDDDTPF